VPSQKASVVLDYQTDSTVPTRAVLERLKRLPYHDLLELEKLGSILGYPADVDPLDVAVSPRGYRVLSHVPRLPDSVIKRVVKRLDGLEAIVRASQRELEEVEGVGAVRAREIREGLRRFQEHNLVDRFLQP
jgi:diadenylate cyclase